MAEWTSLFARKLRAHRAGHGRHGRMTQDELAALLDVSLDAISKYERSLSYIRGDLEHRLTEKLGWSAQDVIACRQDWESGRPRHSGSSYRMLKEHAVLDAFGGDAVAMNRAIARLETGDPDGLPDGFSAGDTGWCEVAQSGGVTPAAVMYGTELVGFVGLVFPGQRLERRFRDCLLEEGELSPDLLRRPILPGTYFAYCPAVYIARGHEAAARLLLSGFVGVLESLADRDILLSEIGAIAVNTLGRQLCEDLGLRFHGDHRRYPEFGIWTLPAAHFPTSLLGRRSATLRRAYEGYARPPR